MAPVLTSSCTPAWPSATPATLGASAAAWGCAGGSTARAASTSSLAGSFGSSKGGSLVDAQRVKQGAVHGELAKHSPSTLWRQQQDGASAAACLLQQHSNFRGTHLLCTAATRREAGGSRLVATCCAVRPSQFCSSSARTSGRRWPKLASATSSGRTDSTVSRAATTSAWEGEGMWGELQSCLSASALGVTCLSASTAARLRLPHGPAQATRALATRRRPAHLASIWNLTQG